MSNEPNPESRQPQKRNTILYIVIGLVVSGCFCCGAALLAQWLLENSDFTLVQIARAIF